MGHDGVILTKLDGDARGGAALSVKAVTGKPIKFVGMGESSDRLEEFRPDGMASRILGRGDDGHRRQPAGQRDEHPVARARPLSGAQAQRRPRQGKAKAQGRPKARKKGRKGR